MQHFILKAGNILATSRESENLMAFISFKEQLLHAFLCVVFCAMSWRIVIKGNCHIGMQTFVSNVSNVGLTG